MRLPGWEQRQGSHEVGAAWLSPSGTGKMGTMLYLIFEVTLGSSQEEPNGFPQISGHLRMQIAVGVSQR